MCCFDLFEIGSHYIGWPWTCNPDSTSWIATVGMSQYAWLYSFEKQNIWSRKGGEENLKELSGVWIFTKNLRQTDDRGTGWLGLVTLPGQILHVRYLNPFFSLASQDLCYVCPFLHLRPSHSTLTPQRTRGESSPIRTPKEPHESDTSDTVWGQGTHVLTVSSVSLNTAHALSHRWGGTPQAPFPPSDLALCSCSLPEGISLPHDSLEEGPLCSCPSAPRDRLSEFQSQPLVLSELVALPMCGTLSWVIVVPIAGQDGFLPIPHRFSNQPGKAQWFLWSQYPLSLRSQPAFIVPTSLH